MKRELTAMCIGWAIGMICSLYGIGDLYIARQARLEVQWEEFARCTAMGGEPIFAYLNEPGALRMTVATCVVRKDFDAGIYLSRGVK